MVEQRCCPKCGANLKTEALGEKVCPRCLLELGLSGDPDDISGEEPTWASPAGELREPPEWIGPYRILELLGEGGMAVVYLAEQREPIRRRVAVKVIKPGMDSREAIARFESERQALALMDHPNIAKVLEAGTTENGRLYFAMEYVGGIPINEYCDRYHLDTRHRLSIFACVCDAIHHAHQKGVIHRDVKPSNVLVQAREGSHVPKVIDFGVAKATNQRLTERTLFTRHGVLLGTPVYMSPEQAELSAADVDTRTDIYSLGVLLYELLVGAVPFDPKTLRKLGYDEMRRVIREDEPPTLRDRLHSLGPTAEKVARYRHTHVADLARLLRGDLNWITFKALEKDPARRYPSASEFSADVNRYLTDEPISARPPGRAYRLGKFIRKNKLLFGVAAVFVLALAVTGLVTSVLFIRAEAARKTAVAQAERNRQDAAAIRAALLDDLPGYIARSEAARKLHLNLESAGPELSTLLVNRLVILNLLAIFEENPESFRTLMAPLEDEAFRAVLSSPPEAVREDLELLARYLEERNDPRSEELYRELLRINSDSALDGPQKAGSLAGRLAALYVQRAHHLLESGAPGEAELLYREAVSLVRGAATEPQISLYVCEKKLAQCLIALERFQEAEPILLDHYELSVANAGQGTHSSESTLRMLVDLYDVWGQPEKAGRFRSRMPKPEVISVRDLGAWMPEDGINRSGAGFQHVIRRPVRLDLWSGRRHEIRGDRLEMDLQFLELDRGPRFSGRLDSSHSCGRPNGWSKTIVEPHGTGGGL